MATFHSPIALWTTCVQPVYSVCMTPGLTLVVQLVILALTSFVSVHAALSARRAASFDVTHDFESLAAAVAKLQNLARSTQMQRVRAAALEPKEAHQTILPASTAQAPLSHEQLRQLARAKLRLVTSGTQ